MTGLFTFFFFLIYRQIEDPKYIHEMIQAASGKPYDHGIASKWIYCHTKWLDCLTFL